MIEKIYKDLQERLEFLNDMKTDMTPKVNPEYTDETIPSRISELKFVLSYIKQKMK